MREYEHSRAISKTARNLTMTEEDLQGVSLDAISPPKRPASKEPDTAGSSVKSPAANLIEELSTSASICRVSDAKGPSVVQWRGEIAGLAPNCAYTCAFRGNDCSNNELVEIETLLFRENLPCSVSAVVGVLTLRTVISAVSTPPQPTYRPSSPTTTLKNSIGNAESK
jgi:hypothetical protein